MTATDLRVARLTALMLAALLMLLGVPASAEAQTRNDSYCRASGAVRLVLIDITTPYDAADRTVIEDVIRDVLKSVKGGDRIVVRTIAGSHTHSERLIERCAPHCEAEGFYARLMNCSDGIIRADHDAVQQDILQTLRSRLSHFQELKTSDILRTIDVAAREHHTASALHVYIYSDLLEHSELISRGALLQFAAQSRAAPLLLSSLRALNLIPPLRGADIRVAGIGRSDARDRRPLTVRELNGLREFWTAYFREAGAAQISIGQGVARN